MNHRDEIEELVSEFVDVDGLRGARQEPVGLLKSSDFTDEEIFFFIKDDICDVGQFLVEVYGLDDGLALGQIVCGRPSNEENCAVETDFGR